VVLQENIQCFFAELNNCWGDSPSAACNPQGSEKKDKTFHLFVGIDGQCSPIHWFMA
jgi:hypothetical protein